MKHWHLLLFCFICACTPPAPTASICDDPLFSARVLEWAKIVHSEKLSFPSPESSKRFYEDLGHEYQFLEQMFQPLTLPSRSNWDLLVGRHGEEKSELLVQAFISTRLSKEQWAFSDEVFYRISRCETN